MKNNQYNSSYIYFIGRTNVGKSSILNTIFGKKISITSHKSGTTIQNIIGILNQKKKKIQYVDTPGMNENKNYNNTLKILNKEKKKLILFIINKTQWTIIEKNILTVIKESLAPSILVINKVDYIINKKILLPFIKKMKNKHDFLEIIPVSAKTGENIETLSNLINKYTKQDIKNHKKKYTTNFTKKFFISEIIREKFIRFLNQEIPYLIKINIDEYKINNLGIHDIYASIIINKKKHKKIIIGKNGIKINICRQKSKKDIEKFLKNKINLYFKIKIEKN
ncbi:GTPase Era [Buchnera aphidicola]|uniref:GTPase Era n=1 Tax=Buchnera aphidicola TaxID=9 RepID=UPI0034646E86